MSILGDVKMSDRVASRAVQTVLARRKDPAWFAGLYRLYFLLAVVGVGLAFLFDGPAPVVFGLIPAALHIPVVWVVRGFTRGDSP